MKRDVVIGASSGYSFDQIKYWINSLDRCGFEGQKAVLLGNGTTQVAKELAARGYVVLTDGCGEEPWGYRYLKPNFVDADMSVERFHLISRFLSAAGGEKYRYVIAVDVRDAVFQHDPSRWLDQHMGDKKLVVASEGLRYADEEWNRGSMLEAFGADVFSKMSHRLVWNAGTFAGEHAFVRELCDEVYKRSIERNAQYSDQAAMNVLLSSEPFAAATLFESGELAWACQGGTMIDHGTDPDYAKKYRGVRPLLDGDIVRTSAGKPFCIVHQYDRSTEWTKQLQSKYA